jgi:glycosyltransferase involved in cell wall biosynthesis
MQVILDISRLVARGGRRLPSGIDRVELAYARHLLATRADGLAFVVATPRGFAWIGRDLAETVVARVTEAWAAPDRMDEAEPPAQPLRLKAIRLLRPTAPLRRFLKRGPTTYVNVSHGGLDRAGPLAGLKTAGDVRIVVMVHDLIPLRHPEYARPGEDGRHRRRLTTVAAFADTVLVNSRTTANDVADLWRDAPRRPRVIVAGLGLSHQFVAGPPVPPLPDDERPYFVCVGTIEPRKNHLLLLNVWRRLVDESGPRAPRLLLVGRRGWENENVLDMLERAPGFAGTVCEHANVGDRQLAGLIRGARALLMPSFVEGFGLPVAEALALGAPVVCSDIAAHREIGQGIPEFLDPLDGPGWRRAVLDYAGEYGGRRARQLLRLRHYQPPRWEAHFAVLEDVLAGLASRVERLRPVAQPSRHMLTPNGGVAITTAP